MNVIVSNKQKNLLDNANIDAIKDLNGLFNVDELINNFKGYFFSKMIIDATSIIDFAKENVLRKLVDGIGAEKIVLLLPEKPEPPKKFCDFLVSLGVYNFSTNINDIVKFIKNPNTLESFNNEIAMNNTSGFDNYRENNDDYSVNNYFNIDSPVDDRNKDRKIVLGFKNVTNHAGSTTLVYMIKKHLEKNFKILVEALEVSKSDFHYFNTPNMISVNPNNIESVINNSKSNIILIDLNDNNYDILCDEVIYLIEPSIIKINKLLNEKRDIFMTLNGKKVVLNKSMLTNEDVSIFSKEAGISIYYNIPYVNDRNDNSVINDFINKLGLVNKGGHGLFGLFK